MRTPFFDQHTSLGAKMIDFHGWEMPVQYSGILDEHQTVRSKVGLFDVSHMGRFKISGRDAKDTIQKMIVNDINKIKENQAIYSPMCYDNGGIVDDIIICQLEEGEFLIVVNSSNIQKDFKWIKEHTPETCKLDDLTYNLSLLALQGKNAEDILAKECKIHEVEDLKPFGLTRGEFFGKGECIISRTGYTGEDGFEIFVDSKDTRIWSTLLEKGQKYGIKPAGLGARDTLRLEAGLMLYGNDIDQNVTPLEAPLRWTVKFEKGDFIGKKSLEERQIEKKLKGFQITDSKRVARHGNKVLWHGKEGVVTSGSFSPTLKMPIGFCYVPKEAAVGDEVKIEIGQREYDAKISKTRFYKRD